MAVVKMARISIIGLERDKETVINALMKLGVVELIAPGDRRDGEDLLRLARVEKAEEEVSRVEWDMERVKQALAVLGKYDKRKRSIFEPRRTVDWAAYARTMENRDRVWEVVERVRDLENRSNSIRTEQNRLSNLIETLKPYASLDLPLETAATRYTTVLLGVVPAAAGVEELEKDVEQNLPEAYLELLGQDRDQAFLLLIAHKSRESDLSELLKRYSFSRVQFRDLKGTAAGNIRLCQDRIKSLDKERESIEGEIASLSGMTGDLEIFYDCLVAEKEKCEASSRLLNTRAAFFLEGWVPEALAGKVQDALSRNWDCAVEIRQPEEDEEYPVLLQNGELAASVENITRMYSLPHPKEADPNAVMAPFFIMFFGLMFSDAGYGLLMSLGCWFLLQKYRGRLEEGLRRFLKLGFYCGLATVFWGALFGSWFGNAVYVISLGHFSLQPLWFDPVSDPERMLLWSLGFGVFHIYTGIGVRGYNLFKEKKYLDILFDTVFWYVFFTGAIFVVLPYLPKVDPVQVQPLVKAGKYLFVAGAVLLVATQGRHNRNIIVRLLSGLAKLYDLAGFVGDVLSYSRLLALGLTTAILGNIINDLGSSGGLDNVLGALVFIVVFIFGHAFNMAINALGSYVHSCRLQYLEFFGKFYSGGGREFSPLKWNSVYTRIIDGEELKNGETV